MRTAARRAFTLIELLVVIAIIAILAAILFPVLARARERAQLTRCLNNLRQVSIAVMTYTSDYGETYPLDRMRAAYGCDPRMEDWTWKRAVAPYLGSADVLRCPVVHNAFPECPDRPGAYGDESNARPEYAGDSMHTTWLPASYAYSGGFFRDDLRAGRIHPRRTTELKNPAATLLILNSRLGSPDLGPWMMLETSINPATGRQDPAYSGRFGPFVAHAGRVPFVMADGHVRALRLTETVLPQDMWLSRIPDWDGATPAGRKNLIAAAMRAEQSVREYH